MRKLFVLCLFLLLQSEVYASTPKMRFQYQELGGDYRAYTCEHKHDSHMSWLVLCQLDNKSIKRYRIHLSVRRYPKTTFGSSGYEVMYWITEMNYVRRSLQHDSITVWIHNSEDENHMRAIELRQGVDNDLAQLNLYLSWVN